MADVITTEYDLDYGKFETGINRVIGLWDRLDTTTQRLGRSVALPTHITHISQLNIQLQTANRLMSSLAATSRSFSLPSAPRSLAPLASPAPRSLPTRSTAGGGGSGVTGVAGASTSLTGLTRSAIAATAALAGIAGSGGGAGGAATSIPAIGTASAAATTPVNRLGAALKTAFTVTGILAIIGVLFDLGKKLAEIVGIGESYENQFTRIFEGNQQAAKGYLTTLQDVADTTNFTFATLTDNTAKLASRGITPTKNEILGLGDVANFIKKDFSQLNEAILDVNSSDRWRELGFTVSTQGKKMKLSYGEFTTTVDTSVKGAYSAIQAFSQLAKVQGSTLEAGKSISGRISTLQDNFAGLFRTIGQGNTDVLGEVVDFLNRIVVTATGLVRTLQPAFDKVTEVFGDLFNATGSLFEQFGKLSDEGETVATTGQKIGFYFNKYVISPFAVTIGLATAVIEAFNYVVIGSRLATAKLQGKDSLAAALSKDLDATKKRLDDIRDDIKLTFGEMRGNLDDFTRADNQRQRRRDRRNRLNQEAYEGYTPTPGAKPTPEGPSDADKKRRAAEAEKVRIDAAKRAAEQIKDKEKLAEELAKIEVEYLKGELERMDKGSKEYLDTRRRFDEAELEQRRQTLIKMGQLATGTDVFNIKTQEFERKPNLAYKLPDEAEGILKLQRLQAQNDRIAEYAKAASERLDQQEDRQSRNRITLQQQQGAIQIKLREDLANAELNLIKKAGESEIEFEKRKQKELLKYKLDAAAKSLQAAQLSGNKEDITAAIEQINALRGEVDDIAKKTVTGRKICSMY